MPIRLDPSDLKPLKVSLTGTINGVPFRTGYWTLKYTTAGPYPVASATAFANVLIPIVGVNVIFNGYGYKGKDGTSFIDSALASPLTGSLVVPTNGFYSNSATVGFGGKAVDVSGTVRTIRTLLHVPKGIINSTELTSTRLTSVPVLTAAVRAFLIGEAMTDNFGRLVTLYPYATLQMNAYYQRKRGG